VLGSPIRGEATRPLQCGWMRMLQWLVKPLAWHGVSAMGHSILIASSAVRVRLGVDESSLPFPAPDDTTF
jgi:hypothetical protein